MQKKHFCIRENTQYEYILVAGVSHVYPHPYGQDYFSHTKMHNSTHRDESDTRVRWPLPSQLSHRWRSRQKQLHIRHVTSSFSTSKWISLLLYLFYDDRQPYGDSLARNTDSWILFLFSTHPLPLALSLFLPVYYPSSFTYSTNLSLDSTDRWCMCSQSAIWRGSTRVFKQTIITVLSSLFGSPVSSIREKTSGMIRKFVFQPLLSTSSWETPSCYPICVCHSSVSPACFL